MLQNGSAQLLTASGVVNVSGKPLRVYGIHIVSGGGGGGVVTLRNGTTASDTAYLVESGTTSKGQSFAYGSIGYAFPNGCYASIDANVTSVTVAFERMDA